MSETATWRAVRAVAIKEYQENLRTRSIYIVTGVFLVFTLVINLAIPLLAALLTGGRISNVNIPGLEQTAGVLGGIASFVVPILALLLAHGTFAGEEENGSLALLLAQPVTRTEVVVGKFLGIYAAVATSLLVGMGVGALAIAVRSSFAGLRTFALFMLITLVWTGAYVAIGMLLSALTRRRGTAMGLSVLAWFTYTIVWIVLVPLLFFFSGAELTERPPGWLLVVQLLNPNDVYGGLLGTYLDVFRTTLIVRILQSSGLTLQRYGGILLWTILALWVTLPVLGAWLRLRTKDV